MNEQLGREAILRIHAILNELDGDEAYEAIWALMYGEPSQWTTTQPSSPAG